MAGTGELLGGGETGGAGTDDGHGLTGGEGRLHRRHPAVGEGVLDNLQLDGLDGHRVIPDTEDAGALTGGGADASGELGEVVGGVQPVVGLTPAALTDQVVPLRDDVAQRAAVMAERDAAVHAAGGLGLHLAVGELVVDLVPVEQTQRHGTVGRLFAAELQKTLRISHCYFTSSMIAAATPSSSSPAARAASMVRVTRR